MATGQGTVTLDFGAHPGSSQILYVIDELDPPTYALPVTGGVQPFGG